MIEIELCSSRFCLSVPFQLIEVSRYSADFQRATRPLSRSRKKARSGIIGRYR